MALQNQLFSAIISGVSNITPGVGGWDTLFAQFMDDRRGRHGFGLLSRILNTTPVVIPGGDPGTILISVPPGWSCLPLFVGLKLVSSSSIGDLEYKVTGNSGAEMWRNGQGVVSLAAGRMMIQWPDPSIFLAAQDDVPWVDGDDVDRNIFTVGRLSAAGNNACDFFTYGFAWQNDD